MIMNCSIARNIITTARITTRSKSLSTTSFCFQRLQQQLLVPSKNQQQLFNYNKVNKNNGLTKFFSTGTKSEKDNDKTTTNKSEKENDNMFRLSKIISMYSKNISISRREAERTIRDGNVTVASETITSPHYLYALKDVQSSIKVKGKLVQINNNSTITTNADNKNTKIWLAHKLAGEVVTDNDEFGRPSLLERLSRGGVGRSKGKQKYHLKSVGRLDMMTEGLILITNDGGYKRQMELPSSLIPRIYRVRVHGKLTQHKLSTIRRGGMKNKTTGYSYSGMKVQIEAPRHKNKQTSTNNWLRVTCTEGKNRQIRNVFSALGLNVTRLLRTSYGEYDLNTIPPGMAIEVPVKKIPIIKAKPKQKKTNIQEEEVAKPVKWIRMVRN